VTLRIEAGARIDIPIALIFASAGHGPVASYTRNLIRVGREAHVTLVEIHDHATPHAHQTNAVTEMTIEDGAQVQHIKILTGAAPVEHLSQWKIDLSSGATYRAFTLTADVALARQEIDVAFKGENAKIDISGLMLGRGRDHIDTTLVIDHAVPHCESRELFKAVLDDTARGVFQGKVIVRPHAQKTDGKQMAKALMLSEACEFDSKPELEIYADDVVCGHGATVAEIDPAMMFYLRSRGIPEADARAMLIESFAAETLDKVEDAAVRAALGKIATTWFAAKRG
jgi:Fe-S cluster assembly protein SufD